MNADPNTPKPWRHLRRTVAVLFYSTLLIWLTYITASRWNGVPADTSETRVYDLPPKVPLDPELDRTAEFVAALRILPLNPDWTMPPPPVGMRWSKTPDWPIDPTIALKGPWTPQARPHLQAVIDHLEAPAVQDSLARLVAIRRGICQLTWEGDLRDRVAQARGLLCVRARYHHVELNDTDGAIGDFESLMRLAATCLGSLDYRTFMQGLELERRTKEEIWQSAFERPLTRAQAERLMSATRSILPDAHTLWQQWVDITANDSLVMLDRCFTIDDKGDGWLVLSRLDHILQNEGTEPRPRLGLWNALSPLFNDRRSVASKIEYVRRLLGRADGLTSPDALVELGKLDQACPFNFLDGPVFNWHRPEFLLMRRVITTAIACRRATVVSLALSAYHSEHGEYPASLDELVGEYLDEVPLDPYDDNPLRYFQEPDDDYTLYSVGINQVDDRGYPRDWCQLWGEDIVFVHQRWLGPIFGEITLEKAGP